MCPFFFIDIALFQFFICCYKIVIIFLFVEFALFVLFVDIEIHLPSENCQVPFRVQWLRGRASDSRLREPGFESYAAVLKPWASFFTLHCCSSLSCINEYLAIDSCGYVYEQPSRINCSI